MAKVWILDTETKGTGANMVPLEKARTRRTGGERPFHFPPRRAVSEPPAARAPRRFKVVDVVSRQVLGEDLDARATVELLEGVRSNVDVTVHVWDPRSGRWRALALADQRALWERRGTLGAAPA